MVFNCICNNNNNMWNIMTMQDILLELSQYDVNCTITGDWFAIGLKFKQDWQVVEPTNPLIECVMHDGLQYYGAPLKDVSIEEVFNCIKETIEYNKDLERRIVLFREKVQELQEIFKNEDYNTLKTIEFKIKKKKDKKKKEENTIEEVTANTEEIIEDDDNNDNEYDYNDGLTYNGEYGEIDVENKPNENKYLEPI